MNDLAKTQFVQWVRKNYPQVYQVAERGAAQSMAGPVGANWLTDIFNNVVETVKTAGPALIQTKAQHDLIKLQLKRAEQGQPPIDVSTITPTIKVQTDITPESEAAINRIAKQQLNQFKPAINTTMILLIGGLGFLLWQMSKRGRR